LATNTQMRWIRGNRRIGAWAALFALAVQFTLSFGHVHLDQGSSSSAAAGIVRLQAANHSPTHPGHPSDANDYCAICATIGLVASSILPEPSGLILPIAGPHRWLGEFEAVAASRPPHILFQARAPPVAA
jgi:hypothetical protein